MTPDRHLRTGLEYTIKGGVATYRPQYPFRVDGIEYQPAPGCLVRTMIELIPDRPGSSAVSITSNPPTEAELDEWVKTNHLQRPSNQ